MLKIIGFGLLLCIGGAIVFALYAAYRITKMGQAMGKRDYRTDDSSVHHNGYITTTGTTIHNPDQFRHAETPQHGEDARDSAGPGSDAGEAVGSSVANATVDFGSTDSGGDSGSSDSGSNDSGSSDSGSSDSGGGSKD